MILVSEVKDGAAIKLDGKIYKVLEVVHHAGSGQMHGFIELKLKDLKFGHFADRHFKFTDKVEYIELTKRQMDYIYADADAYYFMDPDTFNQISVPKSSVGIHGKFLKEGAKATLELIEDEAVSVNFPKVLELRVISTGPGIHDGQDSTLKPATLENGIEIQVPQFVITGDLVRIDTEKIKYIDRVTTKKL
jgi:elongation factor P